MKTRKRILIGVVTLLGIGAAFTVLFGLSRTRDHYGCHLCKTLGDSAALRVFRIPVWRESVKPKWSLTGKPCEHDWQWYSANSEGILLNREDWDGPIGACPF